MKIFTTRQIRELDGYTIEHEPVASIDLMERAAMACAKWLCAHFDRHASLVILAGPGNNGGDGWAIARLLAEKGYREIRLYLAAFSAELSPDAAVNRQRLMDQHLVPVSVMDSADQFPVIRPTDIVIDSLFGSGLSRPLSGLAAKLVKHINTAGCRVISIDIPSGLMGEDNTGNQPENIISADHTLTFQFPKLSFFFPENEVFVGEWTVLDIGLHRKGIEDTGSPFHYVVRDDIACLMKPRSRFSHKGTYGHALLIAGSYGMMGAAILASKACLRTGAGLVTAHVPLKGYEIMQTSVPEAIVNMDPGEEFFSRVPDIVPYNAVGIGPGIGTRAVVQKALKDLLLKCHVPLVIDADALNLVAARKELLKQIPENSILTPHPKEFERIAGAYQNGYDRLMKQIDFARHYKIIVVYKGANTTIALPDGRCYFNSTGNAGMASGGSGDVLTGMILSLLAQGYNPSEAAMAGVYLHGFAGDLAAQKMGRQALIASDIIDHIGKAFLFTEIL